MSRIRRSFTAEYKVEAAHLVIDSGRTIAEVAGELGVNEALLGRWVADERRRVEAAAAHDDGDDGSGICSADPQALSGDHRHAVFGDSSLHTLRSGWRWRWKWSRRWPTTDQLLNVSVGERIWQRLERHVPAVA